MISTELSPLQLLNHFCGFRNIDMVSLSEDIEQRYESKASDMSYRPHEVHVSLTIDNLLSIIDDVSLSIKKDHADMNIYYDTKENKISILEPDGVWNKLLVHEGIKKMIEKVQDVYFDYYECYLIKRIIKGKNYFQQQKNQELLDEYYRFIVSFDLLPFCMHRADYMIMDDDTDVSAYAISERFTNVFLSIKKNMRTKEKGFIDKTVLDIVKRNSHTNIRTLKTKISYLFCNDSTFKDFLEESINTLKNKLLM
jgi:hypothetical protein